MTTPNTRLVEGRVVDGMQSPVPFALVRLVDDWEPDRVLAETVADDAGCFRLEAPHSERMLELRVQLDRRAYGEIHLPPDRGPHAWQPPTGRHEVRVWAAAPMRGHVFDADGKPVRGAWVGAFHAEYLLFAEHAQCWTVTDEEGRFELGTVPLGSVQVVAHRPGSVCGAGTFEHTGDSVVGVSLGNAVGIGYDVEVPSLVAGQVAQVRIVAWAGPPEVRHPLPDRLARGTVTAGETWSVRDLPPGLRIVRCRIDDVPCVPRRQGLGAEHLTGGQSFRDERAEGIGQIVFEPDPRWLEAANESAAAGARRVGAVTGRVVDPGGEPVVGFRVALERSDVRKGLPGWTGYTETETDRRGHYRFEDLDGVGLEQGALRVRFGSGDSVTPEFDLPLDTDQRCEEFVRPTPGSVYGRVVDADGVGRPGRAVLLEHCGALTLTDRAGRFRYDVVDVGRYRLCSASHWGEIGGVGCDVVVNEGASIEVELIDAPPADVD